jgi:hypothetical protein
MDEERETMKRAREVRGQMAELVSLLGEFTSFSPDLEDGHGHSKEILEGMDRLIAAMEEGR